MTSTHPRGGPLYKIAEHYDGGTVAWAEVDRTDGFVHLSAAHQVRQTAAKHFAGREGLVLLEVDPARLSPDTLRWEPSRGGDHFPHVYGDIEAAAVTGIDPLPLDGDTHHFPAHVPTPLPAGALPAERARRMECAEASTMVALGRAAARVAPQDDPRLLIEGHAVATCFADASPINALKGWGIDAPELEVLARAEAMFDARGAAFGVEVYSHADPAAYAILAERGYRALGTENCLVRELDGPPPEARVAITLEPAGPESADAWGHLLGVGFTGEDPPDPVLVGYGRTGVASAGAASWFIVVQGERVGVCSMRFDHDVALLMGSAVLPQHRGRGYHSAAIAGRLAIAHDHGCRWAKQDVSPGSGSHRNAHRAGFVLSHTRTVFSRGE